MQSPGQLKIGHCNGTSQVLDGKPGDAIWSKAESHWAENVGNTEFRGLVIELKEASGKK